MSPLRFSYLILLLGVAAALLTSPDWGESFDARHVRELAGNPADLHFRLEIAGGPRSFRVGERIPITLLFSSDTADKYKLDTRTHIQSGRSLTEQFVMENRDVVDPFRDFYGTSVLSNSRRESHGTLALSDEPTRISLELNNWFRFDKPGRYRLYLASNRVIRPDSDGYESTKSFRLVTVSSFLEIEIVAADATWNRAKLTGIQSVLDHLTNEELALAQRELCYLATPEAVQLSLEHSKKTKQDVDELLLIGARDRLRALTALDQYLADPQIPVSYSDLELRALFTFVARDAPKMFPTTAWNLPWSVNRERLWAAVLAQREKFKAVARDEAIWLIPIAAAKQVEARMESEALIAELAPDAAQAVGLIPRADYGLTRNQLIAGFPGFPARQQADLLKYKWNLVRDTKMIPVLLRLIDRPIPEPTPLAEEILETALMRLFQLSPTEGAGLIGGDINSGRRRFAVFAVSNLPAQNIPEADEALARMVRDYVPGSVWLAARFATARIAGQMRTRYLERVWDCQTEEQFLAYFLRAAPQPGTGGGIDLLRRAMAKRKNSNSCAYLLSVTSMVWGPALESEVITLLDGPNPEDARTAIGILARMGQARVEALLWKRLEHWSAQRRSGAKELDVHPAGFDPTPAALLGDSLFDALARADGWRLDEPRRKRLVALCVDEACRQKWSEPQLRDPIAIYATAYAQVEPERFSMERYTAHNEEQLWNRVRQFPAGTTFRWCPDVPLFPTDRSDALFKRLTGLLSQRSMSIEPYSKEKCADDPFEY